MRKVTIPDVRELVAARGVPSISIYMRSDPRRPGGAGDRARLRGLLRRASDLLGPALDRREVDAMLVPIAERAREPWPEARSVAFLRSRETSAAFALPVEVPELAIVASTFHTKPLVSLLDGGHRFVLLAIGERVARIYEGTPDALVRLDDVLPEGAPPSSEREAWCRAIDAVVCRRLHDTEEPVVLAGEHETREAFRAVSNYPWIVDEGIECDLAQVHVRDLLAPARAIVQAHRADVEMEAAVQYLAAAQAGFATEDLAAVARAAVAGRVRLLLHRRGAHVWGKLDAGSGECAVRSGTPGTGDPDIIDDVCEIVLQHGGDVVEVAPERMPFGAPIGAVVTASVAVAPRRRATASEQSVSP
jgi:hypothetical protein